MLLILKLFPATKRHVFNINYYAVILVHASATQVSVTTSLRHPLKTVIGQPPAGISSHTFTFTSERCVGKRTSCRPVDEV